MSIPELLEAGAWVGLASVLVGFLLACLILWLIIYTAVRAALSAHREALARRSGRFDLPPR